MKPHNLQAMGLRPLFPFKKSYNNLINNLCNFLPPNKVMLISWMEKNNWTLNKKLYVKDHILEHGHMF